MSRQSRQSRQRTKSHINANQGTVVNQLQRIKKQYRQRSSSRVNSQKNFDQRLNEIDKYIIQTQYFERKGVQYFEKSANKIKLNQETITNNKSFINIQLESNEDAHTPEKKVKQKNNVGNNQPSRPSKPIQNTFKIIKQKQDQKDVHKTQQKDRRQLNQPKTVIHNFNEKVDTKSDKQCSQNHLLLTFNQATRNQIKQTNNNNSKIQVNQQKKDKNYQTKQITKNNPKTEVNQQRLPQKEPIKSSSPQKQSNPFQFFAKLNPKNNQLQLKESDTKDNPKAFINQQQSQSREPIKSSQPQKQSNPLQFFAKIKPTRQDINLHRASNNLNGKNQQNKSIRLQNEVNLSKNIQAKQLQAQATSDSNNQFFDPDDLYVVDKVRSFLKERTAFYTKALINQQMTDQEMKVAFSQDILQKVLGHPKVGRTECLKIQVNQKKKNIKAQAIFRQDETTRYLKLVQNCIKQSIKYLKIVYPRNTKMQARSELIDKIEDIDLTNLDQFDMMIQTNTLFKYENQKYDSGSEILDQIKYFLQKMNKEAKKAFSNFEHILKQVIPKFIAMISVQDQMQVQETKNQIKSKITRKQSMQSSIVANNQPYPIQEKDQQYMEILNDPHKFKIGKKLSPDDKHFQSPGSERLKIQTNQLFRLITKWTQDLMDMLESFKNSTEGFYVKKFTISNNKYEYFNHFFRVEDFNDNQVCKKIIFLKSKIQHQVFDKGQDQLKKALAEMLRVVQHNKRFGQLERQQKKMLSFSKKTYEMLREFLQQQLVYLIKSLTDIRYQMNQQWQPSAKNIDFVRFKVTDLLRARVMVGQKLLMDIYKALVTLDRNEIIKIVKIKNRFKTPMSDALIVFKMVGVYNSPVLCQLQLILYKKHGDDNKEKAYQTINHFLYQMERSTYGPLSQLSLLVALKDQRIEYLKLIPLAKDKSINNCFCKKKFQQSEQSKKKFRQFQILHSPEQNCIDTNQLKALQQQSFTCSRCEQTFGKNENLFPIKSCNCGYKICTNCIIQCQPNIYKELIQKIMNCILLAKTEDGNTFQFEFGNVKSPRSVVDCDSDIIIFTAKTKKNKFWKQVQNRILKNQKPVFIFGVLLRLSKFFNKQEKPFFIYKINKKPDNIYFTIDKSEDQQKFTIHEMTNVGIFDTFVFFKDYIKNQKGTTTLAELGKKTIADNIIRNCLYKLAKQAENSKIQEEILAKFKQQMNSKFARTLCLIEDRISGFDFIRKSCSIDTDKLEIIKRLKLVNLQNNRIQSIQNIFHNFQQMQELYLDNNKISEFIISSTIEYPSLNTLSLNGNLLSVLKIQNHKEIVNVFANRNNSMTIEPSKYAVKNNINLQTLQIGQIKTKKLSLQFDSIEKLKVFNFTNYYIDDQKLIYELKDLEQIYLKDTNIKLKCSSDKVEKVFLMKASNIYFVNNINIKQVVFDMSWNLLHLEKLQILQLRYIQKVKLLKLPRSLKKLRIEHIYTFFQPLQLSNTSLEEVYFKNIPLETFTFLPRMKQVILDKVVNFKYVKQQDGGSKKLVKLHMIGIQLNGQIFKTIKIRAQDLLEINLQKNHIKSIRFLEKMNLSSLKNLQLEGNMIKMSDTEDFYLKLFQLQKLNLSQNQLTSLKFLENMELTSLIELNLQKNLINHGQEVPKFHINLRKLITLNLNSNKLRSLKFIEGMLLQSLVTLLINDNQLNNNDETIVKTELNNLQTLSLTSNKILSLKFLQGMDLQSLTNLQLSSNCINHDCKAQIHVQLRNLKKLNLQYNMISSLQFLQHMGIDSLLQLNLQNNMITHDENTCLSINLKNLNKLNLCYNRIVSLKFLQGIKLNALCELDLSQGNKIKDHEKLKFNISMPNLQKLNLANKSITSLEFLEGMKLDSLSEFYAQNNRIQHDMNSVLNIKLSNLRKMDLSSNKISSLKFLEKMNLQSLIQLKLWKNQIWHDDNLLLEIKLKSLRKLNLASNRLTSLRFLEGMKMDSLLNLNLWNNQISHDERTVLSIQLQSLYSLNLQNNKINSIKFLQSMKLPALGQINLNLNKLSYKQIDSINIKLKNLQTLMCFSNSLPNLNFLTRIKLNKLIHLNLGSNKIFADDRTNLNISFEQLKVLIIHKNLIQSMNFLKHMNLNNLEELELQVNNIKHLELFSFPKLQKLIIYHNLLQNIEADMKAIINKKQSLGSIINSLRIIEIDSFLAEKLQPLNKVFPNLIFNMVHTRRKIK